MTEKSRFQKFTVKTVHRSQLRGADYNPRTISDAAKKRLKKSLKDNGLVETLVWNERTGNLVGGHQRIDQLDALHGNQDYALDVSVIDVDERQEAKLNVVLNNRSAMGDFDFNMLEEISKGMDISFDDMLFDEFDTAMMKGDIEVSQKVMDNMSGTYEEIKADKKRIKESLKSKDAAESDAATSDDYALTIVFRTEADKKKFCMRARVEQSARHCSAAQLLEACREGLLNYV